MANLNLTPTQLQDTQYGIYAANAVYSLNKQATTNVASFLQVGQPLIFYTDVAGDISGYKALPTTYTPTGYTTKQVLSNIPGDKSGLNAFIAANSASNTALVGIAGLNGAFGGGLGSSADTAQTAQSMSDQFKSFVLNGGLQQLRDLYTASACEGQV